MAGKYSCDQRGYCWCSCTRCEDTKARRLGATGHCEEHDPIAAGSGCHVNCRK